MWENGFRVTWNTPKTRHKIITGAPNDDRAYNNALEELKWYNNTILYSIIHKAQFKKAISHRVHLSVEQAVQEQMEQIQGCLCLDSKSRSVHAR